MMELNNNAFSTRLAVYNDIILIIYAFAHVSIILVAFEFLSGNKG